MKSDTVTKTQEWVLLAVHLIAGSLFLALCSQVCIPIAPIPITGQTLGLFLLALFQGKNKAFGSTLLYLFYATLGLPVLAGGMIKPLWLLGPSGGYLLSFPLAAFVMGALMRIKSRFLLLKIVLSCVCGQIIIWTIGTSQLAIFFVGFKRAFFLGVAPFIVGSGLKLAIASAIRWGHTQYIAPFLQTKVKLD